MPQIWSNRTLQGLINVRRESNEVSFFITIFCIFKLFIKIKLILKHHTYGTRKVEYWQLVAGRVNNEYGGNFTYQQCRSRFNALVREFYVSLNIYYYLWHL